jgi:hypothetical protein
MAGCKGLVIVAGQTYTSRLWCLLELYVWVAMGKETNRIKMMLIHNEDPNATAEQVPAPVPTRNPPNSP